MVIACWSEKREQRWDIHAVYNQFSTSSIQEVPDAEPGCGLLSAPDPSYQPVPKTSRSLESSRNLSPSSYQQYCRLNNCPMARLHSAQRRRRPCRSPRQGTPPSQTRVLTLNSHGDQVVSSAAANLGLRKKCLRVLREVSSAHGFLPKSYSLSGVTLSDTTPYACGGFAGTWKGQQDENQVCVKAFLPRKGCRYGQDQTGV
jgi:hypothetical protein